MSAKKQLLLLPCSATKRKDDGPLPALERYDGPMYKVLRSFLRDNAWPQSLSVAVLSAEYGLMGGLASIHDYDKRMTKTLSEGWREDSTNLLAGWGSDRRVNLLLGKDYRRALDSEALESKGIDFEFVPGAIGRKLNRLKGLLEDMESQPRPGKPVPINRPLYFLPDWDDMLDAGFDFRRDSFSGAKRKDRKEVHCTRLMGSERVSDGVLLSLAQHVGVKSKGVLKKYAPTHDGTLSPEPIRETFGLSEDQWVFGDCGAFSYVDKPLPDIEPEQALAMYQLYGFDFGASVDHIPVPEISTQDGKRRLSAEERQDRIDLTRRNADRFLKRHKERRYNFLPVGVIQGLDPESYARMLGEYADMGYDCVGIGGLVPRSDKEIVEVMEALERERRISCPHMWIHLFGVYRPRVQAQLRELGLTSFDSATYFRKAWLRSGQNYLSADGSWQAAIRVPMTSDPRTRKRLEASEVPIEELERLEQEALRALHEYGDRNRSLDSTLKAIKSYDFLLRRSDDHGSNLMASYERTLEERPWEQCGCEICRSTGIDVVIFRGANRNKRRGTHNTGILYRQVKGSD